jgi:hypothetical protein
MRSLSTIVAVADSAAVTLQPGVGGALMQSSEDVSPAGLRPEPDLGRDHGLGQRAGLDGHARPDRQDPPLGAENGSGTSCSPRSGASSAVAAPRCENRRMVFVAEALGTWLVERIADACSWRLADSAIGSAQQRELQQAATVAIERTARDLWADEDRDPSELARIIEHVFGESVLSGSLEEAATLTDAIRVGVTARLSVLGDAELTGTGQSSAETLGISLDSTMERLVGNILHQILVRGASGGALGALADQLNHEATQAQNDAIVSRVSARIGQLRIQASEHCEAPRESLMCSGLLAPVAAVYREVRDDKGELVGLFSDGSILYYLMKELVKLGAVDIAVDQDRFAHALPGLPRAFRARVTSADRSGAAEEALRICAPIMAEYEALKITWGTYGIGAVEPGAGRTSISMGDSENALVGFSSDLVEFICAMRRGLQAGIDLSSMLNRVQTLLRSCRSGESRANLITVEQVLSTYRLHRVGAAVATSDATPRLVEIFAELTSDPLYRDLSQHVWRLGIPGGGKAGAANVTRVAGRLAQADDRLMFRQRSVRAPSEPFRHAESDISGVFDDAYFPPIVSVDAAVRRARANWRAAEQDYIPLYRREGYPNEYLAMMAAARKGGAC